MALGLLRAGAVLAFCGAGFLVGAELGDPFPPEASARLRAIGPTGDLPETLRRAVEPGPGFRPLPAPESGDWLAVHAERGQTFAGYARSGPNRVDARRSELRVQPFGPGAPVPELARLAEYVERFFGLETRVDAPFAPRDSDLALRPGGVPDGGFQAHASALLRVVESRLPERAYAAIAVTATDLYPDPDWRFVFGQASLRSRAGVMSLARLGPLDRRENFRRAMKLATHELGHTFGLVHCVFFACLMNGSNSLDEMDRKPMHLCPVCLRKLWHAAPFDPVERYRGLLGYYRVALCDAEAAWAEARLREIAEPRR